MANPEHLAILNEGVEVWNEWREENPYIIPDLSHAHLSGADLSYADLTDTNLSYADLTDTNLSYADLTDTNLIASNLGEANLRYTNLSGVNLSEVNLGDVNLFHSNLSGANLRDANLSRADMTDANLAMSQVIGTNFHNAILTGACIKDWNINSETNLDGVICEYVYVYYDDYSKTERPTIRRPIRRPRNGNFAPGEFASLYKKIIENTDLIISKTLEKDNNINNQGVQFYSDSTIHTWENLRFRSKTEIKIAEALDRTGVLFVPNSLARLNTAKGRENKEADFLICYNGKWGVLEVDGPHHTAERRVEEQERERIFKKNGIKVVERFDAQRCYNNPDEVVQEFFKMIEIGYS
jgi:uncharacterized protein YjbI with pentapeptide repeats